MSALHAMYVSKANCTFENIDLADTETRKNLVTKTPTSTLPLLETEEGNLSETNAILFYFAQKYQKDLLGKNAFENAQINQWIEFASCEINRCHKAIINPVFGWNDFCKDSFDKENNKIKDYLKILEKELDGKNYLVGNRMTLADIVLFRYLRFFMMLHFPDGMRKKLLPHTTKWFEGIMKTKEAIKAYGRTVLCKQPLKAFTGTIIRTLRHSVDSGFRIKPMDTEHPTMRNIQSHIVKFINNRCQELFKDFLPPNYVPQVQKNVIGDSEFTTPCATQIFNMCNKKPGWKYKTIEEVAEDFVKDLKDDGKMISQFKIVVQEPMKKEDKGDEGKKKKKEKKIPKNVYIDIYLNPEWTEDEAINILKKGISLDTKYKKMNIAVDFSSPNIAKEMHVGHLRSTILGESICRILEFLGNHVERINHVGDWGTQFGMLIAYLESINPNYSNEPEKCGNIRDLEEFYKNAKKKFDEDANFKKTAQLKTVDLQKGDPDARKAWEFICQISRENFEKVYQKLGVSLYECGESFYDDKCRKLVEELEKENIVVEDQGAKIIRVEGFKTPMIIVKSDGAIGYDSTDLAALNYRINVLKADWIIYVVATEQGDHFKMLFKAGIKAGFYKEGQVRLDHMAFGLVQGSDGKKISTRKGGSFKLIDLLEEGQENAALEMKKRNEKNKDEAKMSEEYIKEASEKLGTSAIKYYDLKQFRTTGYRFDFKKMLDDKGNTAVYLFYSYVRICSIYRKINIDDKKIEELIKNGKIEVKEKAERKLLAHLLLFNDVIDDVLKDLSLNLLCDYVYGIATKFSEFYEACKIVGNDSRILLTELCKRFMKLSFDLLSLTPIERI